MTTFHLLPCLALGMAVSFPPTAAAQVTITSPSAGQRLAAGPDFATDELGDPWDFTNREDFSPDPGESAGFAGDLGIDPVNGRVVGTLAGNDGQIMLLHRGYFPALNPGRNGVNFPIRTAAYSKLAFKLFSTTAGQSPQVYWYFNRHTTPGGDVSGVQVAGDGSVAGSRIAVVDLSAVPTDGAPWASQANVVGLRIDPNHTFVPGAMMGLDWVRLVPADGSGAAVSHDVQWTGPTNGSFTLTVDESGPNPASTVGIATVNAAASGNNTFAWKYGFLPPGAYRLTIQHSGGASQSVSFTINDPPIVHLTNPDERGGADYATELLGNPWDMNDAADVPFTSFITNPSFSGGEFHATNTTNDPGAWLMAVSGTPIDSARYHRLSFGLRLDGPFDLSNVGGGVSRIFWGSHPTNPQMLTGTGDIVIWPGANIYTIDLAAVTNLVPSPLLESWNTGAKRSFRLDPHEATIPRPFHIDFVTVAANDATSGGQFTVTWTATDADDAPTVSLFYDTDTDPSAGVTPIPGAAGLPAAAGAFAWNTQGIPVGTYFVRAVVTDGVNEQARYSTGPVDIGAGGGAPPPGPGVPQAPANFAVVADGLTVTATWDASLAVMGAVMAPLDRAAATSYSVEFGAAPGQVFQAVPVGNTTLTIDAPPGTAGTFYGAVRGVNSGGAGPRSNEVSFLLPGNACGAAPGDPSGLTFTVSGSTVTLMWSPGSGCPATSYVLEAGSTSGAKDVADFDTNSAATTYVANGVAGGPFYVRVRARNSSGLSGTSNEIIVTVP